MANLTISIPEADKVGIVAFCEATGLTISSLFNVFTKAVLRDRRIPFEIAFPEVPNETTRLAMEEGDRLAEDSHVKTYSFDEAMAELKK